MAQTIETSHRQVEIKTLSRRNQKSELGFKVKNTLKQMSVITY